MFQNSYQNGTCFQVFDPKAPQDKTKNLFKLQNVQANNKVFDKQLKTFIFEFNNSTSKICFPKEDKKQLYLIQQYLNLQIQFISAIDWNIELTVSDLTRTKRRIILSPAVQKIEKKPFFVKFPSAPVKEGVWANYCIDLYSFMEAFKGQTYRSLDIIQITGNVKLRRIFTSQNKITAADDQSSQSINLLPKNFYFPSQIYADNCYVEYIEAMKSQTTIEGVQGSTKSGFNIVSSKSIKKEPFSNKSQIKPQKVEEKGYKNEKKFLANTNGLQIIRNKKQLNDNNSDASKQDAKSFKTPLSTDKNIKKKQPLNRTQTQKARSSIEKKNSISFKEKQREKEKEKEKEKQKLNPWRSSIKKTNSTAGRYQSQFMNERKVQSAETSLYKIGNNLKLNETKGKSFDRRSDCHSDSDYVELSQKFSTVTEGRFFKNELASRNSHHPEHQHEKSHDEIEENIEIEANSFYENSNKKQYNKQNQLQLHHKPVYESINDSLDELHSKKVNPKMQLENQSYFNMSSRFGFGEKMMNKYMQQMQRPYSPPLGEREHTEDQQSTLPQQEDKEVQLIYDPVLNCYYDHKTHTYYQLKN